MSSLGSFSNTAMSAASQPFVSDGLDMQSNEQLASIPLSASKPQNLHRGPDFQEPSTTAVEDQVHDTIWSWPTPKMFKNTESLLNNL